MANDTYKPRLDSRLTMNVHTFQCKVACCEILCKHINCVYLQLDCSGCLCRMGILAQKLHEHLHKCLMKVSVASELNDPFCTICNKVRNTLYYDRKNYCLCLVKCHMHVYAHTHIHTAVFFKTKILLTTTDDSHPVCVSVSGGRRSSAPSVPLTLRKTDSGRKMDKLTSQDLKVLLIFLARLTKFVVWMNPVIAVSHAQSCRLAYTRVYQQKLDKSQI